MLLTELSVCISCLCGSVPCEAWLWAALAVVVYRFTDTGV